MTVQRNWDTVEQPILEAIHEADTAGDRFGNDSIVTTVGIDKHIVDQSVEWLIDGGYVDGVDVSTTGDRRRQFIELRLTSVGARSVGRWPSTDPFESLLQVVDARIDAAQDSDERSRLEKLREGLVSTGKASATALLVAWLKQQAGF